MTEREIRAAINFGKLVIEDDKKDGREVPAGVYERMMELYEQLVELMKERS